MSGMSTSMGKSTRWRAKFLRYQQLESLVGYLLVAHKTPRIERFTRQAENRWLYSKTADLTNSIQLASIICELRLSEVFDRITFPR